MKMYFLEQLVLEGLFSVCAESLSPQTKLESFSLTQFVELHILEISLREVWETLLTRPLVGDGKRFADHLL
ncbi:hypothetical protein SB781_39005, partial [Paraburkholderia sp. SIMBA_061]